MATSNAPPKRKTPGLSQDNESVSKRTYTTPEIQPLLDNQNDQIQGGISYVPESDFGLLDS